MDKLLARAVASDELSRKVIVRVLLDDKGRIQDVILKRSSGNAADDARALVEIREMRFPPGKIDSKSTRRWHELAYSIGPRRMKRERRNTPPPARSRKSSANGTGIKKLCDRIVRLLFRWRR
ncbi:energy transducer TonB [Paraburkholderia dinghuensis]|nr:TonB family protein [Paraburkholderia dinghuensis]